HQGQPSVQPSRCARRHLGDGTAGLYRAGARACEEMRGCLRADRSGWGSGVNGKFVGGAIVLSALIAGAAVWYMQVYGYYEPLPASAPAAEIRLTSVTTGQPEPILTEGFSGIDADSSPLRFRGCFSTP